MCRKVMKNISNFKITKNNREKNEILENGDSYRLWGFTPINLNIFFIIFRIDFHNQHTLNHKNSPTLINSMKTSLIRPTLIAKL